MQAKLIQTVDGEFVSTVVDVENLIPAMEVRGYPFTRLNTNPNVRAELRGQPKFQGVLGPMWEGDDCLRYECPETYRALSSDY